LVGRWACKNGQEKGRTEEEYTATARPDKSKKFLRNAKRGTTNGPGKKHWWRAIPMSPGH